MKKHYGIPYMGSKDKIVEPMIEYILSRHSDKKYFIDGFCGGFAVSQYVLENSKMIVYSNDKWTSLIEFYKSILIKNNFNNLRNEYIYKWITCEKFNDIINKIDDKDILNTILTIIWSFGNSPSKNYLYSKEIAIPKELLHNLLVFNEDKIDENENDLDSTIKSVLIEIRNFYYNYLPENIKKIDYKTDKIFSNKNKRLFFMQYWKKYIRDINKKYLDKIMNMEVLQRLERLERIQELKRLEHLQNLCALERVENLCRINNKKINLYNMDIFDFLNSIPENILKQSIIYLDPPYDGTVSYSKKKNKTEGLKKPLGKWCIEHRDICPIYMSEYSKENSILNPVYFQLKHQNLGGGSGKLKKERLLYNDYSKVDLTMADLLNTFKEEN